MRTQVASSHSTVENDLRLGGVVSGLGSTILGPGPRRTPCSRCSITPLLARLGIRFAAALAGIAIGIVVSSALLDDFAATATGVVIATVLFWIIHIVVQFLALRVLIRQPSIALAGLLALCSTIISLVIVNLLVDDISISGATTYVLATLIIWLCTAVADIAGGRLIRARRREDRT